MKTYLKPATEQEEMKVADIMQGIIVGQSPYGGPAYTPLATQE